MYRVYVYSGASGPDSPRRAVDKTRGEEPPSTHEEREREREIRSHLGDGYENGTGSQLI